MQMEDGAAASIWYRFSVFAVLMTDLPLEHM